jgi:IS30 family transposase
MSGKTIYNDVFFHMKGELKKIALQDIRLRMDARTVRKTIEKRFKKLEPALGKSITFDQGKESSGHRQLSENTGIAVYFCHPHSPWEKGTCENNNYLIRDMLYPVSDFRELTQRGVSKIARLLNERPRKTP